MWHIFRSYLVVLVLFWLSNMGDFSLWYSLALKINIFFENIILEKCKISGLAQIGWFYGYWILRVANFGINYLRHFLINFKKFCAHLAANVLNFPKHPQLFTFWWFWRKVWPKIRKLRNQKICQFEPTLISSLFSGSNFSPFFSSICPKSTKVKNRPYLTVKRAQKHKENSI